MSTDFVDLNSFFAELCHNSIEILRKRKKPMNENNWSVTIMVFFDSS